MTNHDEPLPEMRADLEAVARELMEVPPKTLAELRAQTHFIEKDYNGRYPYELIQNAEDACRRAHVSRGKIKFVVTTEALFVANNGDAFTPVDVDRICRTGLSSKTAADGGLGHKGLGFKSVLALTDNPQVSSRSAEGTFSFHFERVEAFARYEAYLQERQIPGRNELKRWFPDPVALPSRFPVRWTPEGETRRLVEELHADGMTNVFRLPFKRSVTDAAVATEIDAVVNGGATYLPFLEFIESVELVRTDGATTRVTAPRSDAAGESASDTSGCVSRPNCCDQVTVTVGSKPTTYFVFRNDRTLGRYKIDRSRWALPEEWPVHSAGIAIAFPVSASSAKDVTGKLHLGFPTEVPSATGLLIHADFYTDIARRQIPAKAAGTGPSAYNRWLIAEVAEFIASRVVPELRAWAEGDRARSRLVIRTLAIRDGFYRWQPAAAVHEATQLLTATLLERLTRERVLVREQDGAWEQARLLKHVPDAGLRGQLRQYGADRCLPKLLAWDLQSDQHTLLFARALESPELSTSEIIAVIRAVPPVGAEQCRAAVRIIRAAVPDIGNQDRRQEIRELPILHVDGEPQGVPASTAMRQVFLDLAVQGRKRVSIPEKASGGVALVSAEFQFANSQEYEEVRWLRQNRLVEVFDGAAIVEGAMRALAGQVLSSAETAQVLRFVQTALGDGVASSEVTDRVRSAVSGLPLPASDENDVPTVVPAREIYLGQGWGDDESHHNLVRAWRGLPGVAYLHWAAFAQVIGLDDRDDEKESVATWLRVLSQWFGMSVAPRPRTRISRGPSETTMGRNIADTPFPHDDLVGRTVPGDQLRAALWEKYRHAFYELESFAMLEQGSFSTYRPDRTKVLDESVCLERFEDCLAAASLELSSADLQSRAAGHERLAALYAVLRKNWLAMYVSPSRGARVRWYRGSTGQASPAESYFTYALKNAAWVPSTLGLRPARKCVAGTDLELERFSEDEIPFVPAPGVSEMEAALEIQGISAAPTRVLVSLLEEISARFDPEVYRDTQRRNRLLKSARELYALLNKRVRTNSGIGDLSYLQHLLCFAETGSGVRFVGLPPAEQRLTATPIFYDPRGLSDAARRHVPVFRFVHDADQNGALLSTLGVRSLATIVRVVPKVVARDAFSSASAELRHRVLTYYGPYLRALVENQKTPGRRSDLRRLAAMEVVIGDEVRLHEYLRSAEISEHGGKEVAGYLDDTEEHPVLYLCHGYERRDPFLLASLLAAVFTDRRRDNEFKLLLSILDQNAPEAEVRERAKAWLVNDQELDPAVVDELVAGPDLAHLDEAESTRAPPRYVPYPVTPPVLGGSTKHDDDDTEDAALGQNVPDEAIAAMLKNSTKAQPATPPQHSTGKAAAGAGGPRRPPSPNARLGRAAEDWLYKWLVSEYGAERVLRYGHVDDGHVMPDGLAVGADFVVVDALGCAERYIEAKGAKGKSHMIVMPPAEWERAKKERERYEIHIVVFEDDKHASRETICDPVGEYDARRLEVFERTERWIYLKAPTRLIAVQTSAVPEQPVLA